MDPNESARLFVDAAILSLNTAKEVTTEGFVKQAIDEEISRCKSISASLEAVASVEE
jgi:hypothetical protein